MNPLSSIKSCELNKLSRCCEKGCKIGLDGIRQRIIFKGEEAAYYLLDKEKSACDCLIFTMGDVLVIAVVELKGKSPKIELQKKFQNSIKTVEIILNKQRINSGYKIIPILLAKTYQSSPANNPAARKLTVTIKGQSKSISYGKCRKQLADVIAKYNFGKNILVITLVMHSRGQSVSIICHLNF